MQTKFRVGLFMFRSLSTCLAIHSPTIYCDLRFVTYKLKLFQIPVCELQLTLCFLACCSLKNITQISRFLFALKIYHFLWLVFPVIVLVHLRCKMMLWWTYSSLIVYLSFVCEYHYVGAMCIVRCVTQLVLSKVLLGWAYN